MDIYEWKDGIIEKAKRQITYRANMASSDIQELTLVLFDFLDEAISILTKWRKLTNDNEFLQGKHDSAICRFLVDKYNAIGRESFSSYGAGGISSVMPKSPESILKSSTKQVI